MSAPKPLMSKTQELAEVVKIAARILSLTSVKLTDREIMIVMGAIDNARGQLWRDVSAD